MSEVYQCSALSVDHSIPAWYDPDDPKRNEGKSIVEKNFYVKNNPIFKTKKLFIKKISCGFDPLFITCDNSNENAIIVGRKHFLLIDLLTLNLRGSDLPYPPVSEPFFFSDKCLFIPTKRGICRLKLDGAKEQKNFIEKISFKGNFILHCSNEYYFILKGGKLFALGIDSGEVKGLLQLSGAILFFKYISAKRAIYGSTLNTVFYWDFYNSEFKELDLNEGTNSISFGINNSSIIIGHLSGSISFIDLLCEKQYSIFVSKSPVSNLSCNQNVSEFLFWNEKIKGSLKIFRENQVVAIKSFSFKKIYSALITNNSTLIATSGKGEILILDGY